MLNVKRLRDELRFITINPDKHDPGLWAEAKTVADVPEGMAPYTIDAPRPSACGSFGCLAGNTALHEPGVELNWYQSAYHTEDGKKIQLWQADEILGEYVIKYDFDEDEDYEELKPISVKAAEVLGLTEYQAEKLFDGDNNLDRLWALADMFSGGEINGDPDDWYSDYNYALREREENRDEERKTEKVQESRA